MSRDRLVHFIEVGFLMNKQNFRQFDTTKERVFDPTNRSFDSSMTKHLFEFQDKIDNPRAIVLQNKLKT